MPTHDATYIALGTNLPYRGQKGANIFCRALAMLGDQGCQIVSVSGWWTSQSWPDTTLPQFCNAVASIHTNGLSAQETAQILLAVEYRFGRTRDRVNQPRTLDLDLIDHGGVLLDQTWEHGRLICPHPRVYQRSFVLAPLAEIAPGWVHPATGIPITTLLGPAMRHWPCQRGGSVDLRCS